MNIFNLYLSFILSLIAFGFMGYGKKTYNSTAIIIGAVLLIISFIIGC